MTASFRFIWVFMISAAALVVPGTSAQVWAGPPVPSQWQGEIAGQVQGHSFRLPISVEIKQPLPFEKNPLHLFIGTGNSNTVGNIYITSAMQYSTSRGPATLQYFTIDLQGSQLQGRLTNSHAAEAAKANGFSGPNASAEQASDLMKDVLRNAWGPTEMFGFDVGTSLAISFIGNELTGTIQGLGNSYTGTSFQVPYQAKLKARRIR